MINDFAINVHKIESGYHSWKVSLLYEDETIAFEYVALDSINHLVEEYNRLIDFISKYDDPIMIFDRYFKLLKQKNRYEENLDEWYNLTGKIFEVI